MVIRTSLTMAAFTAAEVTWSTAVGLAIMHYTQSSTVTAFPLTFWTPLLTSSLWQV